MVAVKKMYATYEPSESASQNTASANVEASDLLEEEEVDEYYQSCMAMGLMKMASLYLTWINTYLNQNQSFLIKLLLINLISYILIFDLVCVPNGVLRVSV